MKLFLSVIGLFYCFCSYAQEQQKVFFGKTSDDLGALSYVHIINKSNGSATSSNNNGEFRIFAKPKDTLQFTSVGYQSRIMVLQTSDFGINEKQIKLQAEIIELDEIELKNHNLTGNLSSDTKLVTTKEEINAKTLKLPNAHKIKLTVAERRLYTAMGGRKSFRIGTNTAVSVDYIINSISGRLKRLKKLKKIEDNETEIKSLKNAFTNYIINDLKIDSTNVYRFIYFCQEDENYQAKQQKGEFAIIEFLKQKSEEFKTINKK